MTASVEPHRPEAAAPVCCRMLSEGGKIHLQSALVPCFCCACFRCHPCIPAALSPLAHSGRAGCPHRGDTVTLSRPLAGVVARTGCSLAWAAPRAPNSPRRLAPSHRPPRGLRSGPRTRGLQDEGQNCVLWARPGWARSLSVCVLTAERAAGAESS